VNKSRLMRRSAAEASTMAKRTNARPQKARKAKRTADQTSNALALKSLAVIGSALKAIENFPDDSLITDAECEAITRLDRTSLWRIEHGLNRQGRKEFAPEKLLKSYKLGPKRKVRRLGDVRKYVESRINAQVA
jgi:hypothetical protein